MATYDRNLGVWRANDGTSGFASKEEAVAYETTGTRTGGNNTDVYDPLYASMTQGQVAAPVDPNNAPNPANPGGISNNEMRQRQNALAASSAQSGHQGAPSGYAGAMRDGPVGAVAGYYAGNDATRAAYDATHVSDRNDLGNALKTGLRFAIDPIGSGFRAAADLTGVGNSKLAQVASGPVGAIVGAADGLPGIQPIGGGSVKPPTNNALVNGASGNSVIQTPERPSVQSGTQSDLQNNIDQNQSEREQDQRTLTDMYNDFQYEQTADSRQARDQQQQAIAAQQKLYDVLTKFDPEAYQNRASDLALKNQLAIARSQPGGAAEQAGLFNAMRQAPGIQAEAERTSLNELDRRLGMASDVAKSMGDLAGSTRSQDIGESQLRSEFGVRIGDSISKMTGLDWQLDSNESRTLADVALALDQANVDWAKLDLDAQIAEANRILSEKGLAQQWRQFKEGQSISEKDIFGGILTILGAGISGGFGLAAAGA